jgi:hypothetical protein
VKKSSSAIALVLVSAIALPLGCSSRECDEKLPDGRPNPNCQGSRAGGNRSGAHYHGSSQGSWSSGKSTQRGGFGRSAGGRSFGG